MGEGTVPNSFIDAVERNRIHRRSKFGNYAYNGKPTSPRRRAPTPLETESLESLMQRALQLQDIGQLEAAAVLIDKIQKIQEAEESTLESERRSRAKKHQYGFIEEIAGEIEQQSDDEESDKESIYSRRSVDSEESNATWKAMEGGKQPFTLDSKDSKVETRSVASRSSKKTEKSATPVLSSPPVDIHPAPVVTESVAVERKEARNVEEEKKLEEIRKAILEIGSDSLMIQSGEIKKTPLEKINEKLKQTQPHVNVSATPSEKPKSALVIQNQKRMVTKAGMMLKEGKRFDSWKKKYFVLSGRFLLWFKNEKSRSCQGVIELSNAIVEPIAMQIKKKGTNKTEYEIRLRERGSEKIHRIRPFFESKMGFLSDEIQKREMQQWAFSLKNNVAVASKNSDVQAKELDHMKTLQSVPERKSFFRRLFSGPQKEISIDDGSVRLLKFENEKIRDLDLNLINAGKEKSEGEKIDDERKKKHFSAPKVNGAPTQIGDDVGLRKPNEDVYALYRELNVTPKATNLMIKKSYRQMARDLHPDKNMNSEEINERTARFAKIGRAFDVLKFSETRAEYDNCEEVKELLRKGVVVRLHRQFEYPKNKLLFIDDQFLNLYLQDVDCGTVLHKGYKLIELRFVTHIYCGKDGFDASNNDIQVENREAWQVTPAVYNSSLTLHGDRLGQQDWHLQLGDTKSRDQLLEGLRKLRCDYSELFKQRLSEMQQQGKR